MMGPDIKITTIGLVVLLGSFLDLPAIERPDGDGSNEKIPAQPKGGILREDQKGGADAKAAPKPIPVNKVAYLGVRGDESSEALRSHLELEGGLLLSTVKPTSPAGLAGLKRLDVIVSVDGNSLTDQDSLRDVITRYNPGDEVTLKIVRRGKKIEQKVTLGEAPEIQNLPLQAIIPNPAADMNRLLNQQLENALGGLGDDKLQKEMMKQLEKALGNDGAGFKQFKFNLGGNMLEEKDLKLGFRGIGSMKFVDEEGSIEMKMTDGQRELSIRDKEGKLLFEGPYDNDIDKAAVPEEYRERVERIDSSGDENGFRLRFNGNFLQEQRKDGKEIPQKNGE
ncbi:MAG: PDZ domain-containing protein [Akkermansiaceae bacterium]|nr:PDZ domain-containing protein [Akkermansiaceae bacterium]